MFNESTLQQILLENSKELNILNDSLAKLSFADTDYPVIAKKIKKTTSIIECTKQLIENRLQQNDLSQLLTELTEEQDLNDAKSELKMLEDELPKLTTQLKELIEPSDPLADADAILEIRAGAGGAEASLFAEELFTAYSNFCQKKGFKINILSKNLAELGGIKELIAEIIGDGVYSIFKYESGVHRVQRIPKTEANGRIHTSTITVAVLPVTDIEIVEIKQEDLRIDVYRSSGNGGQSVNTTDSAVRITHIPTNIVVTCQDEKSQLKNKLKAMTVLQARLNQLELERKQKEVGELRNSQIGSAGRSEKIRTYNFPQDRITDHRVNLSTHSIEKYLSGEMEAFIELVKTKLITES